MTSNRVNINDANQSSIVNSVSDHCFISDLPHSLLHEIFYRLPIKIVSRCKCVCSSWNKLISEPSFSVDYARYSPFTSLLQRIEHRGSLAPLMLLLIEISDDGGYVWSRIEHKLAGCTRTIHSSFTCVGSCNGFICVKHCVVGRFDAIYVSNPILGDTIRLPSCCEILDSNHFVDYKFGFCPATNKFKVLRTVFTFVVTDCFIDECEIFTVGVDNKWRRLPYSFMNLLPSRARFVSLNGFFHWLPRYKGSGLISTFNLAEEQFGQISGPPSFSLVSEAVNMVVIGNQLTLVYCSATQISIWKMKKHLDVESWTEVVIPTSWFPSELQTGTRFLVAVVELQNGDMIFRCCNNSVIYCNIEQKRCSEIKRIGAYSFISGSIPGYTPNFSLHASLLSRADVRPLDSRNVLQQE